MEYLIYISRFFSFPLKCELSDVEAQIMRWGDKYILWRQLTFSVLVYFGLSSAVTLYTKWLTLGGQHQIDYNRDRSKAKISLNQGATKTSVLNVKKNRAKQETNVNSESAKHCLLERMLTDILTKKRHLNCFCFFTWTSTGKHWWRYVSPECSFQNVRNLILFTIVTVAGRTWPVELKKQISLAKKNTKKGKKWKRAVE